MRCFVIFCNRSLFDIFALIYLSSIAYKRSNLSLQQLYKIKRAGWMNKKLLSTQLWIVFFKKKEATLVILQNMFRLHTRLRCRIIKGSCELLMEELDECRKV